MKLNMTKKMLLKLTALTATVLAVSCQRMQFVPVTPDAQTSLAAPEIPVDTEIPPVLKPLPVYSNGLCATDSSTVLTSCQKCNVPKNPVVYQFSKKGQSLIDIMAIGCSIPNKSAPKNYVPPTKAELIQRLNQLTPEFYPDSLMSELQISTIAGLKTDSVIQQKMFGFLWYQPPYSDAFETYFGLEVKEAVYQLCWQSTSSSFTAYNTTILESIEMYQCKYSFEGSTCSESPAYIAGNIYRNDLRKGMRESISNPYVSPNPLPQKKCAWEKFEGLYELGAAEQIGKWLVSTQKISMEVKGAGGKCSLVNSLPSGSNIPNGEVTLAAYICK